MPLYTDQLGNNVEIKECPHRIVSLVPSQTELLFELGLHHEVVGITKFCIHPERWFRSKTRVGGTKQVNMETIRSLHPDLVIANKEENTKEDVDRISREFPVWVSDVNKLQDALQMIKCIGTISGREETSVDMVKQIQTSFLTIPKTQRKIRAAYLIWKDPYMSVGRDTFVNDMLLHAGFENIFDDRTRYPSIELEEIANRGCDVVLLSSEPYPFGQKHITELQAYLNGIPIALVDGEMFSWYGSRLRKAPSYFIQLHERIQAISVF